MAGPTKEKAERGREKADRGSCHHGRGMEGAEEEIRIKEYGGTICKRETDEGEAKWSSSRPGGDGSTSTPDGTKFSPSGGC